jgi:hypothetical protein
VVTVEHPKSRSLKLERVEGRSPVRKSRSLGRQAPFEVEGSRSRGRRGRGSRSRSEVEVEVGGRSRGRRSRSGARKVSRLRESIPPSPVDGNRKTQGRSFQFPTRGDRGRGGRSLTL